MVERENTMVSFWQETTDEELMALVQVGNLKAFDELVSRHEKSLFRFLRSYLDNVALAEDILQETFLRVFTQRHKYTNQGNFKAWLYRISRNLCIDYKRSIGRRPMGHWVGHDELSPEGVDGIENLPAHGDDARSGVYTRELQEKMTDALATLSTKEREAFLLRRVEQMSYEEISSSLGCTLSAAKMRVKRAFDKITSLMKGVLHDEVQAGSNSTPDFGP